MSIELLKNRIINATVIAIDPDGSGALQMGQDLIVAAGISSFEKILVLNRETGNRFDTYVESVAEPGMVCCTGTDARNVDPGDRIDILVFREMDELDYPSDYRPRTITVDEKNQVVSWVWALLISPNPYDK